MIEELLIGFIQDKLPFLEKAIVLGMFLFMAYTSFIYLKSRIFLYKIKAYCFLFYLQSLLFLIFILIWFFSEIWPILISNNLRYYMVGGYFIAFIFSTIFPLIKYGKGIYILSQKHIRIPVSGTGLDFTLYNKSPMDDEIKISINLPQNVTQKNDNGKDFYKTVRVLKNKKVFVSVKIIPTKYNLKSTCFITINSNVIGEITKKIMIET